MSVIAGHRPGMALLLALLVSLTMALAGPAAQAQASNPFGAGPRDEAGVAGAAPAALPMAEPGVVTRALAWVYVQQRRFHEALTGAVRRFKDEPAALWLLLALSFGYGVFHAAGPGHGKAVLSSYMLANESQVKRGVALAFAAALVQALTAIALVAALTLLVRASGMAITRTANYFEIASYGLIVLIGAWLVWTKGRSLFGSGAGGGHPDHDHAHHHHDHDHDDHRRSTAGALYCAEHGHAHAVDPARLDAPLSLSQAAGLVLAMGLRPCTGGILVLLFTFVQGVFLAGVGAVLVMALGTGLTVAVLASLALGSKKLAVQLAGTASAPVAARAVKALEMGGALLVLGLGVVLLAAAFSAPVRPF